MSNANAAASPAGSIVTPERLQRFLPTMPDSADWAAALNYALDRYAINSPARCAAFLANVAHESKAFRRLEENLDYTPERLVVVFPMRFPTLAAAQPYAHDPPKLANFVYAHKIGNGDEAGGDGWRYRGRGLMQTTGRDNYRAAGVVLHLPLEQNPDLLLSKGPAALSAGYFWQSHGLNELADAPSDANFERIVRKINAAADGLQARRAYWLRAQTIFS